MFEDSLMESTGQIRTRSKWLALASFAGQAAILTGLILAPIIYPAALPRDNPPRFLSLLEIPRAEPRVAQSQHTSAPRNNTLSSLQDALRAPRTIPHGIPKDQDAPANWMASGDPLAGSGTGTPGGLLDSLARSEPPRVARPEAPKKPVKVSSGVATGQLLHPIQPVYPAIAKATRTQGTVVVEARISKAGTIEDLRVISGPPLLRQAAIDAITAARYRPFLLSGEPIEVETTINVIFSLGG